VGNNRFDPDGPITREQMAVLLDNIVNRFGAVSAPGTGTEFTDVDASACPWSVQTIGAMSGPAF
jgi:hypothetical protein